MEKVATDYRLSSYPNSPVGPHYSVDALIGGEWKVFKLFKDLSMAKDYLLNCIDSLD